MKKTKLVLLISFLFLSQRFVYAGGGGGAVPIPATEFTQLLNNFELIISVSKQAKMVAQQIKMIKNQVESLKSIKRLSKSEWGKAVDVLRKLKTIVSHGRALSYRLESIEGDFKRKFPGYVASKDYQASYKEWSETTLDTLESSLLSAGFQSRQFETENDTLRTLSYLSDNSVGQTQALQAGNMIAGQIVNQLQLLRELNMSQIQSQTAYMSREISKEDALNANLDKIIHPIKYFGKSKSY